MSAAERDTERPSATLPGPEGLERVPAYDADRARTTDQTRTGDPARTADQARATAAAPAAAGQVVLPRQRQDSANPTLTLLVIGDDPAGAFTAPWFQDGSGPRVRILRARNLTAADRLLNHDVHCVLLDLPSAVPGTLGAPARPARPGGPGGPGGPSGSGAQGGTGGPGEPAAPPAPDTPDPLDALRRVLRLAPTTAVLVVTDGTDEGQAAEVVRVGAQDHLARHEIDAATVTRAVRYAVERKRADLAQRQLTETRLLAQENSRLERGLLPTPLLHGSAGLRFAARYRPGRSRALLGGDFYDTVRTPDGTVHAMIGDVCGHGPDAAALGVELRIAWRALTFAGIGGEPLLRTLQEVLDHERDDEEIFATLSVIDIAPDARSAGLYLAGHPAPLLACPGRLPALLPYEDGGPALGLLPDARWDRIPVRLDGDWSLMLYTDGLIEGRVGEGTRRLGQEGMVALVTRLLAAGLSGEELLDAAVRKVRELNGGELTDDVAVVLLERRG
ncbi:PP2C family protein-serine/threonine phosphatase [Actinacidiphila sp. ITFR-21]|uniref:PP2C family protein-serine/threonine phosphatase n=1 Tax=Actinacidiphila sp. ITFR-21 TaxID=3075199 RepID=UPI00288A3E65|nr:PP2C family protein-serine/threonine phosphatase [Streptomyces sp. ITFR-21]WNI17033.1 PP2C family protein-serine/threonine phosphatase [Streptomyces sp. ITFR-21]